MLQAWKRLLELEIVASLTHMMHFSDADGERFGISGIQQQYSQFQHIIQAFPAAVIGQQQCCDFTSQP